MAKFDEEVQVPADLKGDDAAMLSMNKQGVRDGINWGTGPYPLAILVPIIASLVLSHFLAALDGTIISTSLGAISAEFNAQSRISWVATAYILTFNAFQPITGKFTSIFGHKIMMAFGIASFFIGSLVCAIAPIIEVLIVGRAFQGMGGACIISLVMITIVDMFPLERRPKFLVVVFINFGVSTVLGPLVGGAFIDRLSWRWCFWLNIILCPISFVFVIFFLNIPLQKSSLREKLARVDYWGTLGVLVFVLMLLLATSWGGITYPWASAPVISCYILAVLVLGGLVYVELTTPEPIIPPEIFKRWNASLCFAIAFFQGSGFFACIFYGPFFFQAAFSASATSSGLSIIPLLGGLVVFSIVSGVLLPVVKYYNVLVVIGNAIVMVGLGMLSTLDEQSSKAAQICYFLIVGVGLGFSFQPLFLCAQAAVADKEELVGITTTLCNFFQSVGGGIGFAVLSAIFNNEFTSGFAALSPEIQAYAATHWDGNPNALGSLPTAMGAPIIHIYVLALQRVFRYALPFVGIGWLLTLCLKPSRVATGEEAKKMEQHAAMG
ncbi:hypothetical protein SmJEL517_g05953 [Synchytrium microbalum]|uniref:Major facilitator superfamily (MFS) profile domain-containing protein n=1 Tax=Synchytrium microbalum TaxID=1806994 RepID=A0A507BT66_9FUNG|nr:uncharacterized protein SmJEL517_g05953 [Synchytrium microbalum]TPX30491.1 hypothetical protein SmJEL517_g05953 [Synchytrium microbalum]